jgi:polyisoprenoid-binding protein YceI
LIRGGADVNRIGVIAVAIALTWSSASDSWAAHYLIDPDHSSILLSATHLGIGTVEGRFEKYSGSFAYDPKDVGAAQVSVKIDAGSINTHQDFRDHHLRSSDFLDVEKYPEITFSSTKVTATDRSTFKILGNLSLHGVIRPIVLQATLGGTVLDMDGKNRIALTITGDINRRDFNMIWNRIIGNSPLVGQIIRFNLNIEGVEQEDK